LEPLRADPESIEALLVALPVKLDGVTLRRMTSLRYIGVFGTSVSNVDMAAAAEAGVAVTRVQHYCDEETAEFPTA
jgi:lactate dehydrogenase-like 2-hydroxyacid dehydrogenase